MRNTFLAVVFAVCFSRPILADSISSLVPPGVDLCGQFNVCGPPTVIEVELGGKGTDTWTEAIALHEVNQPDWCYFADGAILPPGSIWMMFLWPTQGVPKVGLSSPLTWRPSSLPAPSLPDVPVPEPSSFLLVCLGFAILCKKR